MDHERALYMRDIILKYGSKSLCELGHYFGKSSIYIGSILEEQGFGHLTTFDLKSNSRPIDNLIKEFNLENLITVIQSKEGYIWDLVKHIADNKKFDFCYIDGGHTFESTSLAFILIDILLDKDGIIIFDDVSWTLERAIKFDPTITKIPMYMGVTEKQRSIPGVQMVCDILLPHYSYKLIDNNQLLDWRIYQKV